MVTAQVGDVVVWRNMDLVPHTVTAQGRQFDSGDLPPGRTWRYRVTKKGRYPYGCTYHPTMHGVLVVR
jgi:plastocyanin